MTTTRMTTIALFALGAGCGSSSTPGGADAGADAEVALPDAAGDDAAVEDASAGDGGTLEGCGCFAALEGALQEAVGARGVPGMALAVAAGGQLCGTAVAGIQENDENGENALIATTTPFGAASLSRIVTALAMVRAARMGDFGAQGLDSLVSDHVPELTTTGGEDLAEPTLRDLLSGRSGLELRHDLVPEECDSDPDSLAAYVARRELAVWAAAGETWAKEEQEWNTLSIAGRALEVAHSQAVGHAIPFGQAVLDLVPEMQTATYDLSTAQERGLARGHTGAGPDATPVDPATFDCAYEAPADGLYASIEDLAAVAVVLSDPEDPDARELLGAVPGGVLTATGTGTRGNRQSMRFSYNPDGARGPIGWAAGTSQRGFTASLDVRREDGLVLLFVMNKASSTAADEWVGQEYTLCGLDSGGFLPPRDVTDWAALYAGAYEGLAPAALVGAGMLRASLTVSDDGELSGEIFGLLDDEDEAVHETLRPTFLDTFGTSPRLMSTELHFVTDLPGGHATWIEFPYTFLPPLRYCGEACP